MISKMFATYSALFERNVRYWQFANTTLSTQFILMWFVCLYLFTHIFIVLFFFGFGRRFSIADLFFMRTFFFHHFSIIQIMIISYEYWITYTCRVFRFFISLFCYPYITICSRGNGLWKKIIWNIFPLWIELFFLAIECAKVYRRHEAEK